GERSMSRRRLVLALAAAGMLVPAPGLAVAHAPKGFTVVSSGDLVSFAGRQTHGSVECPPGRVPLGGGVATGLFAGQTISSSYPTATGWAADVNNPGVANSTFSVIVTCSRPPKRYTIFNTPATDAPAGAHAGATAVCPAGTNALGGGVFSDSGSLVVTL